MYIFYPRIGIPDRWLIQDRKCALRIYPLGWPALQPPMLVWAPNATTPISVFTPFSSTNRGPPESPPHVPWLGLTRPRVHITWPATTDDPYVRRHCSLLITRTCTHRSIFWTPDPGKASPQPDTVAVSPTMELDTCSRCGRRITWMAGVRTKGEGTPTSPISLFKLKLLYCSCIIKWNEAWAIPPLLKLIEPNRRWTCTRFSKQWAAVSTQWLAITDPPQTNAPEPTGIRTATWWGCWLCEAGWPLWIRLLVWLFNIQFGGRLARESSIGTASWGTCGLDF